MIEGYEFDFDFDNDYISEKELAQLFHLTVRTIQKLTHDGIIEQVEPPDPGDSFNLVESLSAIIKHYNKLCINCQKHDCKGVERVVNNIDDVIATDI